MAINTPETKRLKAKAEFKAMQNSKLPEKRAKVVESYRDGYTMRLMPATQSFIDALALEWVEFVRNDHRVIRVTQFTSHKGIPRNTFDRWILKYPILQEAKEVVWDLIADHRELGVCIKDDQGNTKMTRDALISLRHFDPVFRQSEDEKAAASKQDQAQGNITLQMTPFPNVPEVPVKEIVDEK